VPALSQPRVSAAKFSSRRRWEEAGLEPSPVQAFSSSHYFKIK
jgi:hypothetical protein